MSASASRRLRLPIQVLGLGLALALTTALAGCRTKPSDEDCRRAVSNLQRLTGTGQGAAAESETHTAVRSCLGDSTQESARCVGRAETIEQVDACLKKK